MFAPMSHSSSSVISVVLAKVLDAVGDPAPLHAKTEES
jgi:hypothetical protein